MKAVCIGGCCVPYIERETADEIEDEVLHLDPDVYPLQNWVYISGPYMGQRVFEDEG